MSSWTFHYQGIPRYRVFQPVERFLVGPVRAHSSTTSSHGRKLVSTEQFAEAWLLLFSDCYQRPKLADHGHVPPLCGSVHAGTKPGGQEEKTRDKDKEQHMVTEVQRNLPVVSRKQNTTHFS